MNNFKPPIPIYQLAFLQAYLYEIFTLKTKCEDSFKNTEWFLKENFTEEQISAVMNFFKERKYKCDCDILRNLDLKELADNSYNFHKNK